MCKVRGAGKQSVIVPARSVRIIPGSVIAAAGGQIYYGVVEELGSVALPRELIVSPVYVAVVFCCKPGQRGSVSETKDSVRLHAGCSINRRDSPKLCKSTVSEIATGQEESVSTAEQLLGEMDIGDGLGPEHRRVLVELIDLYSESFSRGEGNLGYCNEVVHHIRTMDDNPIRIPH